MLFKLIENAILPSSGMFLSGEAIISNIQDTTRRLDVLKDLSSYVNEVSYYTDITNVYLISCNSSDWRPPSTSILESCSATTRT